MYWFCNDVCVCFMYNYVLYIYLIFICFYCVCRTFIGAVKMLQYSTLKEVFGSKSDLIGPWGKK